MTSIESRSRPEDFFSKHEIERERHKCGVVLGYRGYWRERESVCALKPPVVCHKCGCQKALGMRNVVSNHVERRVKMKKSRKVFTYQSLDLDWNESQTVDRATVGLSLRDWRVVSAGPQDCVSGSRCQAERDRGPDEKGNGKRKVLTWHPWSRLGG